MNEPHPFYHPEVLRVLRYTGIALLLVLLLAEVLLGLPGPFGLHAGYALLASVLFALIGLAIGRIFDLARSALIDD